MEENVCRICLQSSEEIMKSVFIKDEHDITLAKKIENCCGVEISKSSGFPTRICNICEDFLCIAYKLRNICQNSDNYLRRFIKKDRESSENEDNSLEHSNQNVRLGIVCTNDNEFDDSASIKSDFSLLPRINEVHEIKSESDADDGPSKKTRKVEGTEKSSHHSETDDVPRRKTRKLDRDEKSSHQNDEDNHAKSDSEAFACKQCNRTYARERNLLKHMQVHKDLATGVRKPPEKFGICPFCGDNFPQKSLPVHIKRHTGEKPYGCDQCDMRYVRRQDLKVHQRCHSGEKPHICLTCGKAFPRANQLVRHIRVHTGERPYKCNQCDRGFAQRNDLNLHIRRHTGEKPYKCGVCGQGFINGTLLRNHRKAVSHYEEERRDRFEKIRVTNPNRTYRATPMAKSTQGPVVIIHGDEES